MKQSTAFILRGFITEMIKDDVGWFPECIGKEAYHLFRLIENNETIPKDPIKKENKK